MKTADSSFYITGGTLPRNAPCYVERQADQALYEGLLRGEYCYILTSRQMGKSSLMVRTAARLRQEGAATVCSVDLTAIGQNVSAEQWYLGMLRRIGRQVDLEERLDAYWERHGDLGPMQRWVGALSEVVLAHCRGRVVIFVDEVDAVRSLPFSADEFFAGIRECYNRRIAEPAFRQLVFCLLGVVTPSDLITDPRTTPFNIGQRIDLLDFTPEEAKPLAQGLSRDSRSGDRLLRRVLHWTGGHPYLTQRLCQAAAEIGVRSPKAIDRCCRTVFLSQTARERDDNLLFVRERLLRAERAGMDRTEVLDMYGQIRTGKRFENDPADPAISLLRLSGIIRVSRGALAVRNRVYHRVFDLEWVRSCLPGAELRRQRQAYQRGVQRTLVLASGVLVVVTTLAARARWESVRAATSERGARRLLYAADMQLAEQSIEQHDGARALKLLESHRTDPIRGFEWEVLWRQCHQARLTFPVETGVVRSVAFSADGRWLATGGDRHGGALWNLRYPDAKATASSPPEASPMPMALPWSGDPKPPGALLSIAVSPDGTRLTGTDATGTLWRWNCQTRAPLPAIRGIGDANPPAQPLFCHAYPPHGHMLALGTMGGALLLNPHSGAVLRRLGPQKGVVAGVSFSPDGRLLATSGEDHQVLIWDVGTGRRTAALAGHTGAVTAVAFSPRAPLLVTASTDGTVRRWDTRTWQQIGYLPEGPQETLAIAFSPDGRLLATGGVSTAIKVWDIRTGRVLKQMIGHTQTINALVFSPDGTHLASAGWDGTAKVWEVVDPPVVRLAGATGNLRKIVLSPSTKRAAAVLPGGAVCVWNTRTGSVVTTSHRLEDGEVNGLAFLPEDAGIVAIGTKRGAAESDGAEVTVHPLVADHGVGGIVAPAPFCVPKDAPNGAFALTPDGQVAALGTRLNTITLWNPRQPSVPPQTLSTTSKARIVSLALSSEGRQVAAGGRDGTVHLFERSSGRLTQTLTGLRLAASAVVFSPDGTRVAAGGEDGRIWVWDTQSGRQTLSIVRPEGNVTALRFAPDGKALQSINTRGEVRWWP